MSEAPAARPAGGDPSPVAAHPSPLHPHTLSLSGARLSYDGRLLFDDLALTLDGGQVTCLLGPSGVGKSTLLRLIAGLVPAAGARVGVADGRPLAGRIAYMAQQDLLMPWLTVLENVLVGLRLRGRRPAAADIARARDLLASVGLAERTDDRPAALSGGMRQRAALARTLMEDRPFVLMDEPFSAVDAITRLKLQDLAQSLLAGRTVLLVTHDPLEALRIGGRIHVMAGMPATVGPALVPPGAAPRRIGDPAMTALHADLLERLTGGETP